MARLRESDRIVRIDPHRKVLIRLAQGLSLDILPGIVGKNCQEMHKNLFFVTLYNRGLHPGLP
ncbi:MAG: hypothetical protein AB4352_21240 [Hormoscilla sp.]